MTTKQKYQIGEKVKINLDGSMGIVEAYVDGSYLLDNGIIWEEDQLSPYIISNYATFKEVKSSAGSVLWAWFKWMALGFVTLLVSVSGDGKSYLVVRICATYILGWDWPDGSKFTGETGKVLWCEAESAQQLNMQRAECLGLPLDAFVLPKLAGNGLDDISLTNQSDRKEIERLAHEPDIKLIVVDSLSGADPSKENETEKIKVLKWLADLSKTTKKPLILTHHLNKPGLSNVLDIHRVRGSSAIPQLSRIIWAIDSPDPLLPEKKRLSVIKSNLEIFPKSLGMSFDPFGNVQFDSVAPSVPQTVSSMDRAMNFLLDLLEGNPLNSKDVEEAYTAEGLSKSTVNRAKQKLGIQSIYDNGEYKWILPVKN